MKRNPESRPASQTRRQAKALREILKVAINRFGDEECLDKDCTFIGCFLVKTARRGLGIKT